MTASTLKDLSLFSSKTAKAPVYCLLIPKKELGGLNGEGLAFITHVLLGGGRLGYSGGLHHAHSMGCIQDRFHAHCAGEFIPMFYEYLL